MIHCFNWPKQSFFELCHPNKNNNNKNNYSRLRLIGPPRDRPFMSLISGWNYYPASLFSKKSKLAQKSGPNKQRALLTGALLSGVYCTTLTASLVTPPKAITSSVQKLSESNDAVFFGLSNCGFDRRGIDLVYEGIVASTGFADLKLESALKRGPDAVLSSEEWATLGNPSNTFSTAAAAPIVADFLFFGLRKSGRIRASEVLDVDFPHFVVTNPNSRKGPVFTSISDHEAIKAVILLDHSNFDLTV